MHIRTNGPIVSTSTPERNLLKEGHLAFLDKPFLNGDVHFFSSIFIVSACPP